MGERKIVVGVDGSTASVEALHWAIEQATSTGAALEAITAWQAPYLYETPPLGAAGVAQGGMSTEVGLENAQRQLDEVIDRSGATTAGIRLRAKVVEGHPAPVLVAAAEGADLLVVGSSGHGAFVGMVLGSVTHHVTAHAQCPVVVVRGTKSSG